MLLYKNWYYNITDNDISDICEYWNLFVLKKLADNYTNKLESSLIFLAPLAALFLVLISDGSSISLWSTSIGISSLFPSIHLINKFEGWIVLILICK